MRLVTLIQYKPGHQARWAVSMLAGMCQLFDGLPYVWLFIQSSLPRTGLSFL